MYKSIPKILMPAAAFILIFFYSCKQSGVYDKSRNITEESWGINDSVCFNADIKDTVDFYDILLKINVREDFLTENLWLIIKSESPSGNVVKDTVMYYITDNKGRWFGKKRGNVIKNVFLYKKRIIFPEKGNYLFCISHGMRKKDLPRVAEAGIIIRKSENF